MGNFNALFIHYIETCLVGIVAIGQNFALNEEKVVIGRILDRCVLFSQACGVTHSVMLFLEHIQCRATKYILNDYNSPYKSRLQQLHLLPLMYVYELNNLMFLIKSLKSPTDNFNIRNHIATPQNQLQGPSKVGSS